MIELWFCSDHHGELCFAGECLEDCPACEVMGDLNNEKGKLNDRIAELEKQNLDLEDRIGTLVVGPGD